mgnify:FL=1
MKTFEITVQRVYTTTVEIETFDNIDKQHINDIMSTRQHLTRKEMHLYDEIWDSINEEELMQCNSEVENITVELIKSGEQLFNELGFTSEKG